MPDCFLRNGESVLHHGGLNLRVNVGGRKQIAIWILDDASHLAHLARPQWHNLRRQLVHFALPLMPWFRVPSDDPEFPFVNLAEIGLVDINGYPHAIQPAYLGDRIAWIDVGALLQIEVVQGSVHPRANDAEI